MTENRHNQRSYRGKHEGRNQLVFHARNQQHVYDKEDGQSELASSKPVGGQSGQRATRGPGTHSLAESRSGLLLAGLAGSRSGRAKRPAAIFESYVNCYRLLDSPLTSDSGTSTFRLPIDCAHLDRFQVKVPIRLVPVGQHISRRSVLPAASATWWLVAH